MIALSIAINNALNVYGDSTFHSNTTYAAATVNSLLNFSPNTTSRQITCTGTVYLPVIFKANTNVCTITLNNNLTVDYAQVGTASVNVTLNGNNLYVKKNINNAKSNGTTTIHAIGTGTLTYGAFNNTCSCPLVINTSGTITVSYISLLSTSFTYISGTVITTGSTLRLVQTSTSTTITIDSGVILWDNILIDYTNYTGAGSITLNSLLLGTSMVISNVGTTSTTVFSGSFGFNVDSLTLTAAARTISLASNNTYTVNTSIVCTAATSASPLSIIASTTPTKAKLTLTKGATMDLGFVNFTDIDASDGRTIWVWKPVLSNTNNIRSLTSPNNVSSTFAF